MLGRDICSMGVQEDIKDGVVVQKIAKKQCADYRQKQRRKYQKLSECVSNVTLTPQLPFCSVNGRFCSLQEAAMMR